jgi:hypothetical protein
VNQKKRKISFKSGKYVNYSIYSLTILKKKSKNPTTALNNKTNMATQSVSTGAPSYPMASLYVGKFHYQLFFLFDLKNFFR